MDLSSRLMQQYVAIVEAGGVTHAAAESDMSQSALSTALQRLEDEIGQPLVLRGARFGLTGAGAVLYERARAVVEGLREVEQAVDRIATGELGELSIACPPGTGITPLPDLLQRLFAVVPTARVNIVRAESAEEALDHLRAARAELALVPRIDPPSDVVAVPAGTKQLVLVLPAKWRLDRGDATLRSLGVFPFIDGRRGTTAAQMLDGLRRLGAQPRVVIRNAPAAAVPALVQRGIGAAFLTSGLAVLAAAAGCTVADHLDLPVSPVHLLRRRGDLSPLARILVNLVSTDD